MEEHNHNNMGDHRLEVVGVERITLGDYVVSNTIGCTSSITRPPVQENNFEIKSSLLQLVQ